ncbi:hypothetical protein OROGR_016211 [Orobanche gracilis]
MWLFMMKLYSRRLVWLGFRRSGVFLAVVVLCRWSRLFFSGGGAGRRGVPPAVAGEKSPVNLRSAKDPQSSGPKMSTAAPLESGSGNTPSTSVSPVLALSAVVAAAAPVGAPPGPGLVKCEKKIKNRKELKASHIRGMKTSIRQFHEFAKMADELTQSVDAHGEDTPERVLQAYVVVSS